MELTRAHVPADTSVPVLDTTVGDLLRQAAAEYSDGIALLEGAADRGANSSKIRGDEVHIYT